MKAIDQLFEFKKKLDQELEKFLDQKLKESEQADANLQKLVEVIKDVILRGGKRLRPAFVYFGYQACGGQNEKAILFASQAIEFLHAMALIHDDIIDQSSVRRGRPTAHQLLGESGAILAGDLCFVWADEIFTNSLFKDRTIRETQKIFDLLREEVIFGQYLDVLAPGKKEIDQQEIIKILEYKSGKYTVERPLHLGAALASAPPKALKALSNYGLPLGVAFQIQDDILGIFGKKEEVGKPIDSDLKEGKKTLLVVKTLEKLKGKEKKKFLSLLGNRKATRKDLAWAQKLIVKTDSLAYSRNLAKELIRQSTKALQSYPFKKEGRGFLVGIADFIIERKV